MTTRTAREPLSMGAELSSIDVRDYRLASTSEEFPTHFELDLVPVKNQGSMPTCTAHASSLIVEYFNMKQEGRGHEEFSTDYIFGRRETGTDGKGMSLRDALTILYKYGDVPLKKCVGNHQYSAARKNIEALGLEDLDAEAKPNRITGYYRCNSDKEVKEALTKHGYVIINMPTYKYKIVDDVYTPVTDTRSGYHAVIIYGWDDDKGWLVQNSWGKTWAKDGRFILPFDYPIVEYWGASDSLIGKEVKKPKISGCIATIINWLANYLAKFRK
jgi:hypothetical protein